MEDFLSNNRNIDSLKPMKKFVITLLVVCTTVIGGAFVYLNGHKVARKPVAEIPASQTAEPTPAADSNAVAQQPALAASAPASASATTAVSPASISLTPAQKMAKALLSAKSAQEKQALFDELLKNGQLDDVIADLKQEAKDNPNNAEIPTTLGEAELNAIRSLMDNGGLAANHDQIGILAMEADQEFDAALQIDPNNWEAEFVKASSMTYWPSNPQTDSEVVQRLTSLIDQQETMSANPAFAQTYLTLGNEYQKLGQTDKAQATWALGAQEYPNNSDLQKKLASTQ
jgi:tetratricopeptide (TPR) repeat protein